MLKETKSKVGIFALTTLAMGSLGITPSIGLIMQEFPSSSAAEVQQLTGIPNFMGIVGALIFSLLANRIPRKFIAILAPALIIIGGLIPAVVPGTSLPFLLVCSGILGLGVGMVTNTSNTLITDLIPKEKQEGVMAQNVIFVNLGSIFMTVVGGILATSGGWRRNYLVYLIAVPLLLLIIFCIPLYRTQKPETSGQGQGSAKGAQNGGAKPKLGLATVLAGVGILTYNFVYSAFPNNIALILAGRGIGDPAMAGTIMAVGTVGGIIAGITLGRILRYFQRFSLTAGLIAMGLASFALSAAHNLPVLFITAFVFGFALSIGFAQCPFLISIGETPQLIPVAMAIFSAASSIGGFLSPILTNGISGLFFNGTTGGACISAGIIACVVGIVFAVLRLQARILDRASNK